MRLKPNKFCAGDSVTARLGDRKVRGVVRAAFGDFYHVVYVAQGYPNFALETMGFRADELQRREATP
jgi:hypothetical protein